MDLPQMWNKGHSYLNLLDDIEILMIVYWICWSYNSSSKSGSRIIIKTPKSDSGSGSRDGIVTSSLFTVFMFPIEFDLKIVWISSFLFLPPPLFLPAAKPAGQEVVQGSHFGGRLLKSSTYRLIVKPSKHPQSHNNYHSHYNRARPTLLRRKRPITFLWYQ